VAFSVGFSLAFSEVGKKVALRQRKVSCLEKPNLIREDFYLMVPEGNHKTKTAATTNTEVGEGLRTVIG
jgi:hypothetical protein